MSEIELVNNHSQSLAIAVKPGKHEIVSESDARAWLDEVSSGKNLFVSIVREEIAKKWWAATNSTEIKIFTANGVGFGLLGGIIPAIPLHWDWITLGGVGIVGALSLGVLANRISHRDFKKSKKIWDKIKQVEERGFRYWLKARYDITLAEESSEEIVERLLLEYATNFIDLKGQPWVIKYSHEDKGWFVEPRKSSTVDEAKTIEKVIVEAALPGESGVIFGSIESRLNMLKNYSFAAETSHNLLRIKEDARQAIVSFRKLEALGEGESGENQLVRILSALNDELLAVIQQEAADVRNDLTVQGNYVLSRHLETGVHSAIRLEGQESVDATIDAGLSEKE